MSLYVRSSLGAEGVVESILLEALAFPSSLERARTILCGLNFRFCLHPFYGVLRGTTRAAFYGAASTLIEQKKIKNIL